MEMDGHVPLDTYPNIMAQGHNRKCPPILYHVFMALAANVSVATRKPAINVVGSNADFNWRYGSETQTCWEGGQKVDDCRMTAVYQIASSNAGSCEPLL